MEKHTFSDFNDFLHFARTKALKELASPGRNILHVGAAGSWYYNWFRENYWMDAQHTGVDLNTRPLDLDKSVRWFQEDVSRLEFAKDEEFDMVFAGQFTEHIDPVAQAEFLSEVNRVLKPDGYFVFDTPNARITRKYGWYQPEHIHEWEFQQAYTLAKVAGFEVLEMKGILPEMLFKNISRASAVDGYSRCNDFSVKTSFARAAGPPAKETHSKQASERRK